MYKKAREQRRFRHKDREFNENIVHILQGPAKTPPAAASFVDVAQTAEKFGVVGLFADGIDAGGYDPHRHAAAGAHHEQVDDHFVVGGFLSGEREKTDKQARIKQIPPIIRKSKPFRVGPAAQWLQQHFLRKPAQSLG